MRRFVTLSFLLTGLALAATGCSNGSSSPPKFSAPPDAKGKEAAPAKRTIGDPQ